MTDIDPAEVCTELVGSSGYTASIIEPGSVEAAQVRAEWQPIAQSGDPEERRLRALALWNREFLDLIPKYAEVLRTKLRDVRVCIFSEEEGAALIYFFSSSWRKYAMMIGWDPDNFIEPVFWESIPAPARTFLRQTHAGYNSGEDWESCGLMRPKWMRTMAQEWEQPEGIDGWLDNAFLGCEPIDSRRMLYIARTTDSYMFCTSPDAPPGKGLIYYDGEIEAYDFFEQLDIILNVGVGWDGVM